MSTHLLEERIKEIQFQYLDLLKYTLPMLEDEKYVAVALDSISLFWRRKKPVIDMYLQYVVKEQNTVFYTAATYFDVENGEQYPFVLMGDVHIFDDPLGKYCEICHMWSEVPKSFAEKVPICARDNIDILEKCEGLVLVLPLRSMGVSAEKEELDRIGEMAFVEFFNGIPDFNTYFKTCKTIDNLVSHFKDEYKGVVCLYEDDDMSGDFKARVERSINITKQLMGEGYSIGEYFYFSFFGSLSQAIDVLIVSAAYNATPLIRYPVALHNAFLLLPNFYENNIDVSISKMYVFNYLYKMFNQSLYENEPLSVFYEKVKNYSFESKAISCYEDNNPKHTLKSLHHLLEDFYNFK